jgi:EAL domain-containing protein (putative c-di-GMP-specific phosphodiesterase class I)
MINKIKNTLGISQITTFYQAIISVKTHEIIAYEALVRAWDEYNNLIAPDVLFTNAHEKECIHELDHICQVHAIEAFVRQQNSKKRI